MVAKKKKKNQKGTQNDAFSCKSKHKGGAKCVCVAYQTLRASQEEFFLKEKKDCDYDFEEEREEEAKAVNAIEIYGTKSETVQGEEEKEEGGSTVKRRRERKILREDCIR